MRKKTAVIDYGAGNVFSVATALERLGASVTITADERVLREASRVVFPGVGQASAAMHCLQRSGLAQVIPSLSQPVLGICLGMQLMCRHSAEGDTPGMGIFPLEVKKFPVGAKIPHMGWNTVSALSSGLFDGVKENEWMYFVHSYYVPDNAFSIAKTSYGPFLSAAIAMKNFFGCQFHPEKSSAQGLQILNNFLSPDIEKQMI